MDTLRRGSVVVYDDIILDHYRRPRNRGTLSVATVQTSRTNTVCGDEISLDLRIERDLIAEVAFSGWGCSIALSAASMLTDRIKGLRLIDAERVAASFHATMLDGTEAAEALGELAVLVRVRDVPVRVKCAMLCYDALVQALSEISTADRYSDSIARTSWSRVL